MRLVWPYFFSHHLSSCLSKGQRQRILLGRKKKSNRVLVFSHVTSPGISVFYYYYYYYWHHSQKNHTGYHGNKLLALQHELTNRCQSQWAWLHDAHEPFISAHVKNNLGPCEHGFSILFVYMVRAAQCHKEQCDDEKTSEPAILPSGSYFKWPKYWFMC